MESLSGQPKHRSRRRKRCFQTARGQEPAARGARTSSRLGDLRRMGDRMTVRYSGRRTKVWPTYPRPRKGLARAEPVCQVIAGQHIDDAIGRLLVETVTPIALEVTSRSSAPAPTRRSDCAYARWSVLASKPTWRDAVS